MRILIAGPPKSGNTWLKCLLSSIYGLPETKHTRLRRRSGIRGFSEFIASGSFQDGTILVHHIPFSKETWEIIAPLPSHVVTIIRNPYDMYVSWFFHMQTRRDNFSPDDPRAVVIGKPIDHPDVLNQLATWFGGPLSTALSWMHSNRSIVLRYEALLQNPVDELKGVTDRIGPTDRTVIERAVEQCGADNMRRQNKHLAVHVRAATMGDWENHLSENHLHIFRTHYGDVIRNLGYEVL